MVAKSVFNDTFTLEDESGQTPINIDDTDIAWSSDREYKFKNIQQDNYRKIQWMDMEDCKFYKSIHLYRALHRVDANSWSPQF